MGGLDSILNRPPLTTWDRFCLSPLLFLAQKIYTWSQLCYSPNQAHKLSNLETVRVVCISDTHNTHNTQPALPAGDIIIHAGDLTQSGTVNELTDALDWLSALPHPQKLLVAGNHDRALADPATRDALLDKYPDVVYLQDSAVVLNVRGRVLRVYGSPYTPKHGSWVFQYPRVSLISPQSAPRQEFATTNVQREETELQASCIWPSIPLATDILVTHGPPFAHLDLSPRGSGCVSLLSALWHVRPRLHVCGHIHGARGVEALLWGRAQLAYEELCAGRSGWWGLVRLIRFTVTEQVMRVFQMGEGVGKGTLLVNAAAVGGVKDDQRRGAILVEI